MDPFFHNPYGGRPVSSHANSVESFQLAVHWIQLCLTEHDDCRRAVCPYEWTDSEDFWQSGPSSGESDDSESLYQPPLKRIRYTSESDSSSSQDSSSFDEH